MQTTGSEEGLVVAGAPVGSIGLSAYFARPQVVLGGERFQAAALARMVERTRQAAQAVESAVAAAARAEIAPRAGVTVLVRAVQARSQFCERVFPPALAAPAVQEARGIVRAAAGRCAEWSPAELEAAAEQMGLPVADGGLSLATAHSTAPFLASWWGAAEARQSRGGQDVSPAGVVRGSVASAGAERDVVREAYAQCAAADGSLPPSLAGLAQRAEEAEGDPVFRRRGRAEGGFRWQAFLEAGRREAQLEAWRSRASAAAKHRVERMEGDWVFGLEGELRSVQVSRRTYLLAMRSRFGLPVAPAAPVAAERTCAHVKRSGVRCGCQLDAEGNHAMACGAGGGFVRRHNCIVWQLAAELRRLGLSVRTEVWVDDLAERLSDGRTREARMDIVVTTADAVYYLDVTCFHPFTRRGARRLRSAGGTLEAQEERKRARYVVREAGTWRRNTLALFVPIAVTTFGRVGGNAVEFFDGLERATRLSKPAVAARRPGWIQRAVSAAAVHGAARGVLDACSPPDGQERAHLRGVAAT